MVAGRLRALSSAALLALACAQGGGLDVGAIARVSEDEERALGAQVDEVIRAKIETIDDPLVLGFVSDLGQRLVAGLEPQPFVYRFRVIPNPDLNAFALPGGYVYLHSATVLEAGSLDELAGVLGHEIAHVKARHYARGTEKAFWPSLLARAAGFAGAAASGQPGVAVAAEGINVALQLQYSREFEAEADELGSVFVVRAGFDPAGMGRFFERILADQIEGVHLPPYLYSHPELGARVAAVKRRAASLHAGAGAPDASLEAAFRDAQVRLAALRETGRTSLVSVQPFERARGDAALARADAAARGGRVEDAIALLAEAEAREPNDPRLPFRRGELLEERGRAREAIEAWRAAVALDPSFALAFYRLGTAFHQLGDRHGAAYYFEQAERRFQDGGAQQRRARLALETLSYPPLTAAGLADGRAEASGDTPAGAPRESFSAGDAEAVWWARLDPRYAPHARRVVVRWTEPAGARAQEGAAEILPRGHVGARLAFAGELRERFGIWRVEALLDGRVIDRRAFRYGPEPAR